MFEFFGLSFFMTLKSASVVDFIADNFELYMGGVIASLIFVVIIGFLVYKLPPLAHMRTLKNMV